MSIKYAILGLLHYKDMHGYQIKDHIEKNFGNMWTVNFGQIYTTLKSLHNEGLISLSQVVASDTGGPHKKLYSITERGRTEFRDWLKSPPEKQMLLRDPFLMRFIFSGFGEKNDALRHVEGQIEFYEKQLAHRKANIHRWQKQGTYVNLVAELGIGLNELFLTWLHDVRERLKQDVGQGPRQTCSDSGDPSH